MAVLENDVVVIVGVVVDSVLDDVAEDVLLSKIWPPAVADVGLDVYDAERGEEAVVDAIAAQEPEVAACCVPECVYRGFCPEFKPCGYCNTPAFQQALAAYREVQG